MKKTFFILTLLSTTFSFAASSLKKTKKEPRSLQKRTGALEENSEPLKSVIALLTKDFLGKQRPTQETVMGFLAKPIIKPQESEESVLTITVEASGSQIFFKFHRDTGIFKLLDWLILEYKKPYHTKLYTYEKKKGEPDRKVYIANEYDTSTKISSLCTHELFLEIGCYEDFYLNLANKILEGLRRNTNYLGIGVSNEDRNRQAYRKLLTDKDFVLRAIREGGDIGPYIGLNLLQDREVVLEMLKLDSFKTLYLLSRHQMSKKYRNDEEIMIEAIRYQLLEGDNDINNSYFLSASKALQQKKSFILKTLNLDGRLLRFLPDNLRDNKKFVLPAVKQDGSALQFASKQLKSDREVALIAVKNFGRPVFEKFVGENLKNDASFLAECSPYLKEACISEE